MTDRRSFVAWLGTLATALRWPRAGSPTPVLRAVPTVLYRQPDGRSNLVRVTVTGLDAPAARARVTGRRGVGTPGGANAVPDRPGSRQAARGPPARATRAAAPVDAVLDRFEPYRPRTHRPARALCRSAPPQPRRGTGAPADPSRFPMDGGVRASAGLLRGASRAGGG